MQDYLVFEVKGRKIKVSPEDAVLVGSHSWYLAKGNYVMTRVRTEENPRGSIVGLHRLITHANPGQIVDHENHDPLDNRRSNLRVCLQGHNTKNTSRHKDSTNKYKGITRKPNGKYAATIGVNYKVLYLGVYPTQEEAAKAYNEAAKLHFGEFASLNRI